MAQLEIHQFPCLSDNYGVLIHDGANGVTAAIDVPDAATVRAALSAKGWRLTHILSTHHHNDHTAGNLEMKSETGCTIIGPRAEAQRIPGIDRQVGQGDRFKLGSFDVDVLDTPGHTAGHISFVIPAAGVAFVGDTVFAMGCGRIIEGNAEMMWASLQKIMQLPPETKLYCGHEYTVANARFALTIEPENEVLVRRLAECEKLRAEGKPTLPTTLSSELATNPFLRPHVGAIRKRLNMEAAPDWQVFGEIRERKNRS